MAVLKHINGFTLMEAVVSMIIIMACYVMSTMIYLNIVKTDNTSLKVRAFLEVENLAGESIHNSIFEDQDVYCEGLTIQKRILPYKDENKIKLLSISAIDEKGKVLYAFKQLIISK